MTLSIHFDFGAAHFTSMLHHFFFFTQASQPITTVSELLEAGKEAHEHPTLNLLPEIQTPPPEEPAPTPSELNVPCTENSSPQDAPVLSIDTLTPPPEADPSVREGFVKDPGKSGILCKSIQGFEDCRSICCTAS